MRIALSVLTLIVSIFPVAAATPDEESQKGADHYNTLLKYDFMASADVIQKYGKALRVLTWLKECNLNALADKLAPTKQQISDVVTQYLTKQRDGSPMLLEVLAGVTSSVEYYRIGFKETAGPMKAAMGEQFCTLATTEANKLLGHQKDTE